MASRDIQMARAIAKKRSFVPRSKSHVFHKARKVQRHAHSTCFLIPNFPCPFHSRLLLQPSKSVVCPTHLSRRFCSSEGMAAPLKKCLIVADAPDGCQDGSAQSHFPHRGGVLCSLLTLSIGVPTADQRWKELFRRRYALEKPVCRLDTQSATRLGRDKAEQECGGVMRVLDKETGGRL